MANVAAETTIRAKALGLIPRIVLDPMTETAALQVAEQVVQNLMVRGGVDVTSTSGEMIVANEVRAVLRQHGHNVHEPAKAACTPQGEIQQASSELTTKDAEMLEAAFKYHAPEPGQIASYHAINTAAKAFAETILRHCPASADRSHAMRVVRDARMWANAAIALQGQV